MVEDRRNDPKNRKGVTRPAQETALPKEEEPNWFVDAFGKVTHTANGLVKPAADVATNPGAPFELIDGLVKKIPIVGPLVSNGVPGLEEADTLVSIGFNKIHDYFDQAADYVAKHGKANPNSTKVASADSSLGGNAQLPNKKTGKDNTPTVG
jgi:hypothetical protein